MERKLLDMMNQLFISEYNSRVEYGAQFQFVKLKILSIERNALLHTLLPAADSFSGLSAAGSSAYAWKDPADMIIGRVNCFTAVRHHVPDAFFTYSGKSRISSRFPSFTDTTAVWPGSTSLLVPYW